jgi:hypothetical protein
MLCVKKFVKEFLLDKEHTENETSTEQKTYQFKISN